jgi:hypothetical protein
MRSGPGPEATVDCFAVQLGVCWAEMGPHYDSLNESVIPVVKNAAPKTPHPRRRTQDAAPKDIER